MLQLKNIVKTYVTGDLQQDALKGVSLSFRENEFVSILGQSGSGKTTLLNIIGGLDRYTSGDLIINGISTEKYKDADWDYYRNHSIGFVFQSYNLIPHQSVLANVELALTLAGISRKERRARAVEMLTRVGLADHIHKRPNQMSGGQMQRVAIARALINNPDILLADEPTGALDSETSVQIMELLKEIAKEKLVIMVTHNPELADRYSTRIIRLLDGTVMDDSNPPGEKEIQTTGPKKHRKISVSLPTALNLSFNNLRTKKGRTFLTAFAGSIGIIGIALILSLSTGIQSYVDNLQRDTLSSYPISIQQEESPFAAILTSGMQETQAEREQYQADTVYSSSQMQKMFNAMFSSDGEVNNLTAFKAFLDQEMASEEEGDTLKSHIETIQYQYPLKLNLYVQEQGAGWRNSDMTSAFMSGMTGQESTQGMSLPTSMMEQMGSGTMSLWSELLPGEGDELVSPVLKEQYDLAAGRWPEAADEMVLVLNRNNEISDVAFYALGRMSDQEVTDSVRAVMNAQEVTTEAKQASFDEILNTTFRLVLTPDLYTKEAGGTWRYIGDDKETMELVIANGMELRIVGILQPNPDAAVTMISGSFGYTTALTEQVIAQTNACELVKEQKLPENSNYDVLTGLPFLLTEENNLSDTEKAKEILAYFESLNDMQKTDLYTKIQSIPSAEYMAGITEQYMAQIPDREAMITMAAQTYKMDAEKAAAYLQGYTDEELNMMLRKQIEELVKTNYAEAAQAKVLQIRTEASVQGDLFGAAGYAAVGAMFDQMIQETEDETVLAGYYDSFMPSQVSGSTLDENLALFSAVSYETPSAINIYAKSFEDKELIADAITAYNEEVAEEDRIQYTDYVALLMSGVNTMINAVSYGLIAFVSISLIVSSIMIGIITYISVLERTKEIGILRSVGASKRDISRVFNAETAIIGLASGLIGIGITLLLNIPISILIRELTGIDRIAQLPTIAGAVLVLISVSLTMIAGLIPSKLAAKKDPVIALRSE